MAGLRELVVIDAEEKSILAELSALHAERIEGHAIRPKSIADTGNPPALTVASIQELFSWAMAATAAHTADVQNAKPNQIEERKRAAILFSNFIRSAVAPMAEGFQYGGRPADVVFREAAQHLRDLARGNADMAGLMLDDVARLERKIELLMASAGFDVSAVAQIGRGAQAARLAVQTGNDDGTLRAAAVKFEPATRSRFQLLKCGGSK